MQGCSVCHEAAEFSWWNVCNGHNQGAEGCAVMNCCTLYIFLFLNDLYLNSPHITATKFYVKNGTEVVWSNKTVKWTYKYYIFAVDGGSPKRGDRIPLNITFDATCEKTGAVVANPLTGEVFFRAPGLTGSIYRK